MTAVPEFATTILPLTLAWTPAPQPGRTLFVVLAYHGADGDDVRRTVAERWESASARGHRIVHRDHYANPRPLPYLLGIVGRAIAHLCPAVPPDVVIDSRHHAVLPDAVALAFGHVEHADINDRRAWTHGLLARARHYDHVVLIYADALGLGCQTAERCAMSVNRSVLVINGRRRAFRLDALLRTRLRMNRWLAHTRIAERGFAMAVRPLARSLAAWDRLTQVSS
jgi:hypothetical protein